MLLHCGFVVKQLFDLELLYAALLQAQAWQCFKLLNIAFGLRVFCFEV